MRCITSRTVFGVLFVKNMAKLDREPVACLGSMVREHGDLRMGGVVEDSVCFNVLLDVMLVVDEVMDEEEGRWLLLSKVDNGSIPGI